MSKKTLDDLQSNLDKFVQKKQFIGEEDFEDDFGSNATTSSSAPDKNNNKNAPANLQNAAVFAPPVPPRKNPKNNKEVSADKKAKPTSADSKPGAKNSQSEEKPNLRRKKPRISVSDNQIKEMLHGICEKNHKVNDLYTNLKYINEGASGKVYSALHVMTQDRVALKVLLLFVNNLIKIYFIKYFGLSSI